MQNYGQVIKAQGIEADSAGLAQQRYGIYLNSVEAAQNRLTDSWNKLATTTTNSGLIIFFMNAASAAINLVSSLGGIVPLLVNLAGIFVIIKATQITNFFISLGAEIGLVAKKIGAFAVQFVQAQTVEQWAMRDTQAVALTTGEAITTAFGVIGIVIAVAVAAYTLFSQTSHKLQDDITNLTSDIQTLNSSIKTNTDQIGQLGDLFNQYDKLGGIVNKTTDQIKSYYDVQSKIKDILPGVAGSYDLEGRFILAEGVNLQALIKLKQDEIDLDKEKLNIQNAALMKDTIKQYEDQAKSMQNMQTWLKNAEGTGDPYGYVALEKAAAADLAPKLASSINAIAQAYENSTAAGKKMYMDQLKGMGDAGQAIIDYINSVEKITPALSSTDLATQKLDEAYTDLATSLGAVSTATSVSNSILASYNKTKGLSFDDVQKLLTADADNIKYLKVENGLITLNTTLLKADNAQLVLKALNLAKIALANSKAADAAKYAKLGDTLAETELANAASATTVSLQEQVTVFEALYAQLIDTTGGVNDFVNAAVSLADTSATSFIKIESGVASLITEYDKLGQMTPALIDQLKQMFPDSYAQAIYEVNGQTQLNVEVLHGLVLASVQATAALYDQAAADATVTGQSKDIVDAIEAQAKAYHDLANRIQEAVKGTAEYFGGFTPITLPSVESFGGSGGGQTPEEIAKQAADEAKRLAEQRKSDEKALTDLVVQYIRYRKEQEKQALEDQLSGYKKIIDAKKTILDQSEAELQYQEELAGKEKTVTDIQNQLAVLSLDNSQEAHAKRLDLQNSLVNANKDLTDAQHKHEVDSEKTALDKEYTDQEASINAKVKLIDDYLSKTGVMVQDAITMIKTKGTSLYKDLIAWNAVYGTGIQQDIIDKWNAGLAAFKGYANGVTGYTGGGGSSGGGGSGAGSTVPIVTTPTDYETARDKAHGTYGIYGIPKYDNGATQGFVGGQPPSLAGHQFAQLMTGELPITPSQMNNFMNSTLPNLSQLIANNSGGGLQIDNLLNLTVQGNMTKDLIPQVETIVNQAVVKLNNIMLNRGYKRNAVSYSG